MKGFLLIILSCRVLSYDFPIFSKTEKAIEDVQLHENSSYLPKMFCGADYIEELSSDTLTLIKRPRFEFLNTGAFTLFPGYRKWLKKIVTYSIRNVPRYLNLDDFKNIAAKCFNLWREHTHLKFVWVSKDGDIVISFYGRDHRPPFNQPVLAYANAPGRGLGGDVFLNGNVTWTMDNNKTFKKKGISIVITLCHEIGHALGVGHSDILGALMNKEYTPSRYKYARFRDYTSLQLHEDDIAGIQALYGSRPKPSQNPKPVN